MVGRLGGRLIGTDKWCRPELGVSPGVISAKKQAACTHSEVWTAAAHHSNAGIGMTYSTKQNPQGVFLFASSPMITRFTSPATHR